MGIPGESAEKELAATGAPDGLMGPDDGNVIELAFKHPIAIAMLVERVVFFNTVRPPSLFYSIFLYYLFTEYGRKKEEIQ